MHTGIGIFEWLFWTIAIVAAVMALYRGERLSSASGPGIRVRSGALLFLWLVAIFGAVAGLVTAAIDLRMNAS